jgi:hypothetical protein
MPDQFAGRFYDIFEDSFGATLKSKAYGVFTDSGATIVATTYTDRTKATTTTTHVTDSTGMAEFFAVKGTYYVKESGGSLIRKVDVLPDPADIASAVDQIAHAALTANFHGIPDAQRVVLLDENELIPAQYLPGGTDGIVIGSNEWLIEVGSAQAFKGISSIVRDANGALLTANIVWPDDTAGTFVGDTVSTAFPGFVDAWHFTYADTPSKTVTQSLVTRSANGDVTVQPPMIVSSP